jgi:hypothetical protein
MGPGAGGSREKAERLTRLAELFQEGVLSQEEFEAAAARLAQAEQQDSVRGTESGEQAEESRTRREGALDADSKRPKLALLWGLLVLGALVLSAGFLASRPDTSRQDELVYGSSGSGLPTGSTGPTIDPAEAERLRCIAYITGWIDYISGQGISAGGDRALNELQMQVGASRRLFSVIIDLSREYLLTSVQKGAAEAAREVAPKIELACQDPKILRDYREVSGF